MPDNEIPIKITGDSSSLKQATDDAKDQLEKAGKSVEMLGDLIGVKIPDAIKDMIASSELIGPALSEAFGPLALITAGIQLFEQLSEKIKQVTNDMAGWDASAKDIYADLVKNNEELVRFNESLEIQKLHLNEIGKTGVDRLNQQIDNNNASIAQWKKELDAVQERLKYLQGSQEEKTLHIENSDQAIETTQVTNKSKAEGEELAHWDENIKKTQASVTELTERIKRAQEVTGQGLIKEKDVETAKETIAANEQVLAAKKQVADAERQLAIDTAHTQVEQGKITAAQEEDIRYPPAQQHDCQ
jgi:hypothetical protein